MSQQIALRDEQVKVRTTMALMRPEFLKALPEHVSVDRFERIVITAINSNPRLVAPEVRASLLAACMRAAQDGLLPDGREGALVTYGSEVQWQPMVGGLLKKVRNSGELKDISASVVRLGDEFDYWTDENGEHLKHRRLSDDGPETHAYVIARTKDGGIYIDVMTRARIERARAVSKSKDGPAWKNWWDEQAVKTVIRHISKRLPMSTDAADFFSRNDEADFDRETGEVKPAPASAAPTRPTRLGDVAARGETADPQPEPIEGEFVDPTQGQSDDLI